ncbi:hypothetical protein [Pseudoramibacter alactolyticus]|uniref:hypothetical protein n=1 Tax=Pseudoramibacter alactolyticus TaxID=113287 RepID=UPI0028F0AE6B|nr:hypothetical protein [Pseudoramibacter alactolyticus]
MTETKAQIASLIRGGPFAAARQVLLEKYPRHPIALGGPDVPANWGAVSMMRNAVKNDRTRDPFQWPVLPPAVRNGLTRLFCQIVQTHLPLRKDDSILRWYRAFGSWAGRFALPAADRLCRRRDR